MKQRIFYLDLLRSFAIIMVLLLHSISSYIVQPSLYGTTSWFVNLVINAFTRTGVPIFLMISGCLMLSSDKTRDFGRFYKKSITHLLIPLIFWNVAYFICKVAVGAIDLDLSVLVSGLLNSGTEYHLWYLYTLIGIYLLAPFLKIIVDNCSMKQLVWLLVLMLFGTTLRPFINTVTPVYVYFFDALFNGYVPCFLMGYILSKTEYNKKTIICFTAIGVLGLICSVVSHHLLSSKEGINLVFNSGYSLCHYAMAAALFVLAKCAFENRAFLRGIVTLISQCSFGMYLIHVAVIDITAKYFMIDAAPIISSAYIFIISTVISLLISFLLGKIKYVKKLVS